MSARDEWCRLPVVVTDTELLIGGKQVMQAWERPLMEALAREVTAAGGDVLEVGFGMGISAQDIITRGCRSYTVIEAHPQIAAAARNWGSEQALPVTVLEGFWQDLVPDLPPQFDGILFDTFPICQEEAHINPAAMIPDMQRLLRPGGVLTYYSGATANFPQDQTELLLTYFDEVKLVRVTGLEPYPHPRCDYWNQSYMVLPVARKRSDQTREPADLVHPT
jgi:guanidinoacetate N-methyltransferase